MRRTTPLFALFSVALALTSCTALYYPGDDYEHAEADAGPLGPEASTDAASEADALVERGPPLVCPTGAYCDDFERSDVRGTNWAASGSTAIDTLHAHSPTRSLSATSASKGDGSGVEQSSDIAPSTRFEVWIFAPDVAPGRGWNFRIAQFLWGDACDWDLTWELIVNTDDGLVLLAAAYDKTMNASCGPIANSPPAVLLAPAALFAPRWHHVVVHSDVSNQKRKVSVQVDDGQLFNADVTSSRSRVPSIASLAIGLPCIRRQGGCEAYSGPSYEVWLDDLVVTPE